MEEKDKVCRDNLRKVQSLCGIERKATLAALGKDVSVASIVQQEENNIAMFNEGAEERAAQISSRMQKQKEEGRQIIEDEEELDLTI